MRIVPPSLPPHHSGPASRLKCSSEGVIWMCRASFTHIGETKQRLETRLKELRKAFDIVSPTVKYSAKRAITKFLQMPLVSVRICRPSSGMSFTILLEMFAGTDYLKMGMLLNQMAEIPMEGPGGSQNMERSFVKMLLNLANHSTP